MPVDLSYPTSNGDRLCPLLKKYRFQRCTFFDEWRQSRLNKTVKSNKDKFNFSDIPVEELSEINKSFLRKWKELFGGIDA